MMQGRQLLRVLMAWAVLAVVVVVSGLSASTTSATGPSGYMLDNGKIRFGGGGQAAQSYSTVASVHSPSGMLQQPFYRSAGGNWFKLTFSDVRLSMTMSSGTGTNHWTGGVVPSGGAFETRLGLLTLDNLTVTATNWTETRRSMDGISAGHGTLVATGTVVLNGQTVEVRHTYTLGATDSFARITTRITNLDAAPVPNAYVWVGTRDDWVGTSDGPTKTRGTIVDGGFTQIANRADPSDALLINSGNEGVLFYSTTPGTRTVFAGCCNFINSYDLNPDDAEITRTHDGSYAIVLPVGDLAPGASRELDWFYAAGSTADLDTVIEAVAEAAAASSDLSVRTDVAATIDYTVGVAGTASYMLVASGSAVPSPAQVVAGVAYGDPVVTPVSVGAVPVTAATPLPIAFTDLSPATAYVAYVVTSYVDNGTPMLSEMATVGFVTRAGAPTLAVTAGSRSLDVSLTPGGGVAAVTNYEWSVDGGAAWTALSPASPAPAFSIIGLDNGTEYEVAVRAVVGSDAGMPSATVAATPVRAAQTIRFPALQNRVIGAEPFVVAPTASSGLDVTVSSVTPAVCTTAELVVTVSAVGACTLRAEQAGDVDVAPATAVERTFQVTVVPVVAPSPVPTPPAPPPTVLAPPARPVAVIGGVPTVVAVRVPEAPGGTAAGPGGAAEQPVPTSLEVTAGPVRAAVQVPGAGQVRENEGAVAVQVVRDRAGVLAGEGARPGSTVRAVVHTVGGEARPVAEVVVAEDGSYSGVMRFDALGEARPLPIGAHVVRLVAETPAGEELAIDVVLEIAQPDPAPERLWATQEIPSATPGEVLATNAGGPETVELEVVPVEGRAGAVADGWSMAVEISGDAGSVVATGGGSARIEIVQDAGAAVEGDGFMPDTRVDVWLFSTPVLLGSAVIGADGSFSGFVPVDGSAVEVGEHTLQLQGVGADGYVRALNVGVVVAGAESPAAFRLPEAGASAGEVALRWAILLAALGGLAVLVGGGRRRRLDHELDRLQGPGRAAVG